MPTVEDSYYGTLQSNFRVTNRYLLLHNDKLLDRLNAVERYLNLPLSTWHSAVGAPSEHGIPHYMLKTSEGDEYIRDRVDFIRDHAGAPAFPWESVPNASGYRGRSRQCAMGIPPLVELSQAIGRIFSGVAVTNRYMVTIRWNGTNLFSTPQIVRENLNHLSTGDPLRRIQFFQVYTDIYNWRRAPRLINPTSPDGPSAPARSEFEWYVHKNNILGSMPGWTPPDYYPPVDIDTEDPTTYIDRSAAYVRGQSERDLSPPHGTGYEFHAVAKHWEYAEELRFDWEVNPFADKTITFPVFLPGAGTGIDDSLTPLELYYSGSGAWTTDTGSIPETPGEDLITVLDHSRRNRSGQVRCYRPWPSGETLYDSGQLSGESARLPLPSSGFDIRGADAVPTTVEGFATAPIGEGTVRWLWPSDAEVNLTGSGPIVPGQGLSAYYSQFKDHVAAAEAFLTGETPYSRVLEGGYQEIYRERFRRELGSESGSTWLYWLRPELLEVATRPA